MLREERLETHSTPPNPLSREGEEVGIEKGDLRLEEKERRSLPFREVIVSYLVPALHPLIQRNNDIQPAVSISLLADLSRCTVAIARGKSVLLLVVERHRSRISYRDACEDIFFRENFSTQQKFSFDKKKTKNCLKITAAALNHSITIEIRLAGKKAIISLARRRQKLSELRACRIASIFRTIEII